MILNCSWIECLPCGFFGLNQEFLLPVLPTAVCQAVESSQLETARGAAPVLAMSSKIILYGFSLWHIYQGLHQNQRTAVHTAVGTCLFCTKTSQARLTFPVSRVQQGLKATGSKLVLALMFSSLVLIFLSFSSWWERECIFFPLPVP